MSVVEKAPTRQSDDITEWRICHAFQPGSDIARCGKKKEERIEHSNEECFKHHEQCIVCLELSPTWSAMRRG